MKKKGRAKRITLGILLPLVLGSFFFVTWGMVEDFIIDGKEVKEIIRLDHQLPVFLSILKSTGAFILVILLGALYASFASGIQSVLFSFVVEYLISPKIENNLIVLFICGSLGVISGFIADCIIPGREILLIPIGGVTGVIVGKILRDSYNRSPEIEA